MGRLIFLVPSGWLETPSGAQLDLSSGAAASLISVVPGLLTSSAPTNVLIVGPAALVRTWPGGGGSGKWVPLFFYWNWPSDYQEDLWDGQRHYPTGSFGEFTKPQHPAKDPNQHELMRAKVVKVRKQGYIETGSVISLLHFFCVPKGSTDIRMVYNGTGCGLNESVWSPHFGLPTVRHTIRSLLPGYHACDMDVGEMFLNFLLHEEMKQMSGVDVSCVRSKDIGDQD